MKGPLFGLDREIRLGALDEDEGDEDVGDGGFSSLDDACNEFGELGVLVGAGGGPSARRGRGGGDIESVVDNLDCCLHEMFCEIQVSI